MSPIPRNRRNAGTGRSHNIRKENSMNKSDLRQLIRERKRQYSSEELEVLSLAVIRRILRHPKVVAAQTIMAYYALPDEVNTHQLVDELLRQGKKVLLPKIIDGERLELRVYSGREAMQEATSFHILEPVGRLFTDYENIDLALVPGVSFDKKGNRLGRGKGYYDRLLASIPHAYKVGVCFDFQKVELIPASDWDIPVDEVVSD